MARGYNELHKRITGLRTPIALCVLAFATASHLIVHVFLAETKLSYWLTGGGEILVFGVGVATATWILLGWLARSVERTERANAAWYEADESLKLRSHQIEALYSASRLLSGSRDVAAVAEPLVELACRIAGAHVGAMVLYMDPEDNQRLEKSWRDPKESADTEPDAMRLLAEPCATCPETEQCGISPETLCIPIRTGAELLGVLRLGGAKEAGATTRRTLDTLASEIVAAVWGQRAEQRALEAVRSVGRNLNDRDDLADIPRRFLEAVRDSLGAVSATLYRVGETPEPIAEAGAGVRAPRTLPRQPSPGNTVWTEGDGRRVYARGGEIGLIALEFAVRPKESSSGMQLLGFMAVQAETLIRVAEMLNRLAWKERRRLADELHDGVAQTLASTHLRTSAGLQALRGGQASDVEAVLEEIREATLAAYDEVRDAIDGLHMAPRPGELDGAFIRRVVSSFAVREREDVSVTMPEGLSCQPHALPDVIRVIQEALANALRHGHADRIAVRIAVGDTGSCVMIEDDGAGFDTLAADRQGHYGIAMMRGRAAALGGRIAIDTAPGKGCCVFLYLPHGIFATAGNIQNAHLMS